ncbi:MAG: YggT family protein [Ktedonobacteraceae bacterium]|nr:YggT family protein [Ktedonobacteraceae bacterium]
MSNNPYPDEPHAQTAGALPRSDRMEDLPLRAAPASQVQPPPLATNVSPDGESEETRHEEALTVRYAIGKLNDFLQWFIAVLEVTLAIRFILMLIGADPNNLFAGFLYALTDIILFPFRTIVHSTSIHPPYEAFEWSTLIAMAIYALLFWAVGRFLRILISSPEEPVS